MCCLIRCTTRHNNTPFTTLQRKKVFQNFCLNGIKCIFVLAKVRIEGVIGVKTTIITT